MPSVSPIFDFVFTDHALTEMVREGRAVYQARREMGKPPYVVTVYQTSKIENTGDKL